MRARFKYLQWQESRTLGNRNVDVVYDLPIHRVNWDNNPRVALCITKSGLMRQFLLQKVDGEIRGYPVIPEGPSVSNTYYVYDKASDEFSATPRQGKAPIIFDAMQNPKKHFFDDKEISALLNQKKFLSELINLKEPEEKEPQNEQKPVAPHFDDAVINKAVGETLKDTEVKTTATATEKGTRLTTQTTETQTTPVSSLDMEWTKDEREEVQKKLYFSLLTPTPNGLSFHDYLEKNILSLPEDSRKRVLQAAISNSVFGLTSTEGTVADDFRREFFTPDRIMQFSKLHITNSNLSRSMPPVGIALDYYMHCVQAELKKLGENAVVQDDQIRPYEENDRVKRLGLNSPAKDLKPVPLVNNQKVIDCILSLISPPYQMDRARINLILKSDDFYPARMQLREVLEAGLTTIRTNDFSKLTVTSKSVFNAIAKQYPIILDTDSKNANSKKEFISDLFSTLENAYYGLFSLYGDRNDNIEKNQFVINVKERLENNKDIEKIVTDNQIFDPAIVDLLMVFHELDKKSQPEDKKFLTKENIDFLKGNGNLEALSKITYLMRDAGVLTPENFTRILKFPYGLSSPELVQIEASLRIMQLSNTIELTQENFLAITDPKISNKNTDQYSFKIHSLPAELAKLDAAGILTQENFNDLVNKRSLKQDYNPKGVADVLVLLDRAGILNEETRKAISWKEPAELKSLLPILNSLYDAGILTEANLTKIPNAYLFNELAPAFETIARTSKDRFHTLFSDSYNSPFSRVADLKLEFSALDPNTQHENNNPRVRLFLKIASTDFLKDEVKKWKEDYDAETAKDSWKGDEPYLSVRKTDPKLVKLLTVLETLDQANMLDKENFTAIKNHPNPELVASLLVETKNNQAPTKGFVSSLFYSEPKLSPAVQWLKTKYEAVSGMSSTKDRIFTSDVTYDYAIKMLEKRLENKIADARQSSNNNDQKNETKSIEKIKSGATYKTLEAAGKLPKEDIESLMRKTGFFKIKWN